MTIVALEYVEIDEKGVARIKGKRSKVINIAMDKTIYGWDADKIHKQYPHLTLTEIHSALAYYYDHKQELDRQIEESIEHTESMRQKAGDSPLVQKLRDMGKIS